MCSAGIVRSWLHPLSLVHFAAARRMVVSPTEATSAEELPDVNEIPWKNEDMKSVTLPSTLAFPDRET